VSDVTRMLDRVQQGEVTAAEQLLPLVYEELRHLAAQKLSREKPGQTLQPTALVHEAWLRLARQDRNWTDRKHFILRAGASKLRALQTVRGADVAVRGGDVSSPQPARQTCEYL